MGLLVAVAREECLGLPSGARCSEPWVSGEELVRTERVVGEEEVVDRVGLASGTPLQPRLDPRPHAPPVRYRSFKPDGFGEGRDHAVQDKEPETALLWGGE